MLRTIVSAHCQRPPGRPDRRPVGKRSLMSVLLPSSSILLIQPAPGLREIIHRYFPAAMVDVCSSFENALTFIPLNRYQVVICPQSIASRDQYSLLRLNRRHNYCAPFIVTTNGDEFADVKQAIDHDALGFMHGTTTTTNIVCILENLLALYRLRFSLARRWKWVTDYRDKLRSSPFPKNSGELSGEIYENRVMCEQALVAIEGSVLTFRAQADDRTSEARQRMWEH